MQFAASGAFSRLLLSRCHIFRKHLFKRLEDKISCVSVDCTQGKSDCVSKQGWERDGENVNLFLIPGVWYENKTQLHARKGMGHK